MKKYVSKLLLQKNIIKWDDLNYIGTFQQYIYKDVPDIYRFLKVQVVWMIMQFYDHKDSATI